MLSFHFFKCAGKGSFETQPYFSAPETFTFHEAGRSMIEMLAVLVIVGILSITALAGLMSAWAKHKANLIVHDVVLMAVDLIQDHALGSDFIPEADVLYTIDTYDKSFTVTAKNISKRVCKKLLDMNVSPFSDIYINDGNETCGNENDIHFVPSKENLGDVVPCGEKPCVHGRCINNTCQCEDGWIGTYCHLLENGRCGDGTVCDAGEICVNNQCQTCDKEWQTAFCSRYNADGTCSARACTSSECIQTEIETLGGCCPEGETSYCSTYGTDGTCQSLTCKTAPCHEVRFDSVATCCLTGYSGYCTRYNADGTCASVACTKGTCTSVNIDQAAACCTPEQTPYCSNYNAADQCTTVRCGNSRCAPEQIDSIGTCCQSGETPYCIKYNTDETCASASCMSDVCEQDRIDTLGTCCRSDQTIYCSRYDATGQCTAVDCASAPCTPMSFDTIGVCVSPSRFAYCRSYGTDGKCTNVNTVFYSPYATAYCSSYYSNTTQCQTASVCYGSVTQGNDGKDVCTQ